MLLPAPAWADAGTHAVTFLKLLGGTRHSALGGALSALPDGAETVFGNPAALLSLGQPAVSFLQIFHVADMRLHQVAVAFPVNAQAACGAGLGFMDYGAMPGRDASGYDIGNRTAGDLDATLAGAWRVSNRFSIGLAGKYLGSELDASSARSAALDAGMLLQSTDGRLRGGLLVQHCGGRLRYEQEAFTLPRTWRAGVAWSLAEWPLTGTLEAVKTDNESLYWCGGVDIDWNGQLALRAGYRTRAGAGNGLSAGLATTVDNWTLAYAFQPHGELGDAHRLSLTVAWGSPAPPAD